MASLSVVEKRMLASVRYEERELPFRNPTMNRLRKAGLVEGRALTRRDGKLSVNYAWRITEKGIEAEKRGWHD